MNSYDFFKAVCIAILLISCGTKKKHDLSKIADGIEASSFFVYIDNPDIVTIDNEKVETFPSEKFADMIEDVRYIPLVSKEPIGELKKILIHKERIYVLDAYVAQKVFIFNMKGEIIKVIDSRGGGPKEYAGLMDMSISLEDDYLVINDRLMPNILYFTLDGEFVKKIRSIPNSSLETVNGKVLNQLNTGQSFDDDVNYMLVVTDGDSIIRKGFPHYPIQYNAVFDYPFYRNYRNELLFCPFYCDTVYQIINDRAYTVRYVVKHKKSFWERYNEKFDYFADDERRLMIKEDYTILSRPFLETERFVYYLMQAKKKFGESMYIANYFYWYDKNRKISFTFDAPSEDNRTIHHFLLPVEAIYDNCFAGIIRTEVIEIVRLRIKETGDAVYKNKELRDLFLDENPDLEGILMLYKFKSNYKPVRP
jgi:hypothetical protein